MDKKYKRVLVKLSGEALGAEGGKGFNMEAMEKVAKQICTLVAEGTEVALVIGGGNIWRGREGGLSSMDRCTADYMGMLSTVLNALAMQDAIERVGKGMKPDGSDIVCRVQTAIEMRQIAEPYARRKALDHLKGGKVVIFACGTGSPFFTTDTTAALRAAEIGADALLFAKNIDYIYTADPKEDPFAKPIYDISYLEVIEKGLKVMDFSALTLCMDNHIPILVFALKSENAIIRVAHGERMGTIVS